jgi:pimeloyl-ACP methyl ester carboxylesterase
MLFIIMPGVCLGAKSDTAPVERVQVGDINMAYKSIGDGYPLILITGSDSTMDLWPPQLLSNLSSLYRVIIFDNRGMGYTSAPPGDFSIEQFANDTVGLMDALGIKEAHVLGWSMGAYIAQEMELRHPEKVNKMILYAGSCGGSEAALPSPEVLDDMTNTTGTPEERGMRLIRLMFPPKWLEDHPDIPQWFPIPMESSSPENIDRQNRAVEGWTGTCDRLSFINSSTMVITGTEDLIVPPENALILVSKIPGAWLVRFAGAGHGLMYQYPDKLGKIVADFLEM